MGAECNTVLKVLAARPEYGDVVRGYPPLRKMRVSIPKAGFGKSGGYRLIYSEAMVDEVRHVLLLRLYFKGDRTDLDSEEYNTAHGEARSVLADVLAHDFRDLDVPGE